VAGIRAWVLDRRSRRREAEQAAPTGG
jgi:hypothetical protein